MSLVLIGDVHGDANYIIDQINCYDSPIVQIGDLGFKNCYFDVMNYLGYQNLIENNKEFYLIPGNHDDYDNLPYFTLPNGLHSIGGVEFFSIRGGHSIDKKYRIDRFFQGYQKSWWSQEEMSKEEMYECMAEYGRVKPDIVISHECPSSVSKIIGNPDILQSFGYNKDWNSDTAIFMQSLLEIHRPKFWYYAHYHLDSELVLQGTNFKCLNINEVIKI